MRLYSFLDVFFSFHRVSKRCHRILSNTQVWTHVDFWQEQNLTKKQMKQMNRHSSNKTWIFPTYEDPALAFLRRYTGGCLKSIYLRVVSEEILIHLKQNCTNLETISFHSASDPPIAASGVGMVRPNKETSILPRLHEILPLPKTLKVFSLFHLGVLPFDKGAETSWNTILECFGKCANLYRLTCDEIVLSKGSCAALQESKITDLSFLNVRLADDDEVPINTGLLSLVNLTEMKSF